MKTYIVLLLLLASCASVNHSLLPEDELFLTRKYIGIFKEYRILETNRFGNAPVLLISTINSDKVTNVCVYSKKCEFNIDDRLYIKRELHYVGALTTYWIYNLESDDISYRLKQFEFEGKMLVQYWF